MLTADARDHYRQYEKTYPYFGTAPQALLVGLAALPDELEVHVVSCTQRPLAAPEKLAPHIWYHSLLVPKLGWLRTGYQGCVRAVRRKLRELRPDIVHGQGTERDCAISAAFSGFPNVVTVHGNARLLARLNRARPFSYGWLAARLETFTLPRTDGVVCITRYTQEAVRSLVRRTWVVPNAVDAGFFALHQSRRKPPLILCVGHIIPRKNQQQFIRAMDALAATREMRVLFVGEARPDDPYAVQFRHLLQSRPWCQYGGLASREELKALLCQAWVLALPSIEDNCPMAVMEAMAAGVPACASKVGGIPELIQDGLNGLLFDPREPASMGQTVQRLLDDDDLALSLAQRARETARQRFHPESIARQHLEIYREVLSRDS